MFLFLLSVLCLLSRLDEGDLLPHNDSVSYELAVAHGTASCWTAFIKAWPPSNYVDLFSVVLSLVAFLVYLFMGVWGSPCRVFFPPPRFLVLGGWVGDFRLLLFFASCISLSLLHLGKLGPWTRKPSRPPQPLVLARLASPVSCWESSVGRAETKGCGVTGGVVTPHTV